MLFCEYKPCHRFDLWISFTKEDFDLWWYWGMKRRDASIRNGDHENYKGSEKMAVRINALGAVPEGVIDRHFGFGVTPTINTYKKADLPFEIEARLMGEDHWGLRVKPHDDNSRRVVGVVIEKGAGYRGCKNAPYGPFRVPGWVYAGDGKNKDWLSDPGDRNQPIYLVPQNELRDVRELESLILQENPFQFLDAL